jgi:hypothetical protein
MEILNSKRKYVYTFIEGNYASSGDLSIYDILNPNNNYEYIYALQANIDLILDLKVGEKISLKFNRYFKDSDGVIKRIY